MCDVRHFSVMHNSPYTNAPTHMRTHTHPTHHTRTTFNTEIGLEALMGVDKVLWQQNSDDAGRSEGQNSDGEHEGWVE